MVFGMATSQTFAIGDEGYCTARFHRVKRPFPPVFGVLRPACRGRPTTPYNAITAGLPRAGTGLARGVLISINIVTWNRWKPMTWTAGIPGLPGGMSRRDGRAHAELRPGKDNAAGPAPPV
jgi:hypothetical protein